MADSPISPQVIGNSGLLVLSATHSAVDVLPTPGNKLKNWKAPGEEDNDGKSNVCLTWFAVQQND